MSKRSQSMSKQSQSELNQLDVSNSLAMRGDQLKALGDISSALNFYRESLKIKERIAPNELETAFVYHNIGSCYRVIKKPEESIFYLMKALAIKLSVATDEPTTANTYSYLGSSYFELGDTKKALEYQNKSLEIRERKVPNTPAISDSYSAMGQIYSKQKDFATAAKLFQKSVEILSKHKKKDSPDLVFAVEGAINNFLAQGDLEAKKNNFSESTLYYQQVLNLTKIYKPNSSMHAVLLSLIGKNALSQDDITNAFLNTQNAIRIWEILPKEEKFDSDQIFEAIAYNTMGKILQIKARSEEEISKYFEKAVELAPTKFETAEARDYLYALMVKNIDKSNFLRNFSEKDGAKIIVISQNEEGVIRANDKHFDALITYGIQTCSGVIISDEGLGVHILQHHDMFTDVACISESINREKLVNPRVTLVYNATHVKDYSETKTIQDRIISHLKKNNIPYNEPFLRTDNLANIDGGVLVSKDGVIDTSYFLVEEIEEDKRRFVLAKDFVSKSDFTCLEMDFVPNDPSKLTIANDIAKVTFFAEKRMPFLRYDGERLNQGVSTLTPKLEHYLRVLREEGLATSGLQEKITMDRENGLFELEGDKWYNVTDDIGDCVKRIFENFSLIVKSGCLPLPSFVIDNSGRTVLAQNVRDEERARRQKNSEDYRNTKAAREC